MSNLAHQVHQLLNTMLPAEKSYVKKTFSANEKNMSQLFDDLNKCVQFERKLFLRRYKNRPYMKYLSQNCNYLLKSITKSLIDYNVQNLTEINIMNRLSSISLLVKKGMFSACFQKIDKEIELALTYQYYEYGYKLIKLKERFYKIYLLQKLDHKEHFALVSQKKFFIKQLQLIDDLELLCTALSNAELSKSQKLNLVKEKFKEFDFLTKDQLPGETPLLVKTNFNYIKYKVSELNGEPELKYLKQNLIEFDNLAFLKAIYFENYTLNIANYFEGLIINEKFDLFFNLYDKYANELKSFAKWDTMQTSPLYYIIEYFFYIKACLFSKNCKHAIDKVNQYQEIINGTNNKAAGSIGLYAVKLNATVFFNNGYFSKALDAIELLQNDKKIKTQYFYRLMQILCHYKLDNQILVHSLINSLTIFLRKHNKKGMLKDFLQLKKCLLQRDCNKFEQLKYLPYVNLNTLKNANTNFTLKKAG